MTGWIKLHRKIEDNIVFKESPAAMFVFMRLLLKAAHEPTTSWWKGEVKLDRGQVMISRRELRELTGFSDQNLKTILRNLQLAGIISTNQQKANGPTIISVCNYETYQQVQPTTNQQTNQRSTNGLTNQEKKEEVKKKEIKDMFDDRFAEFWDAFADKRGRPQAEAAWKEAIKRSPPDEIIAGAKRYRSWMKAQGDRAPTPKMAQGWLNDCRWQDELALNGSRKPTAEEMEGKSRTEIMRMMGAH